jgi:hypothetical protein
MVNEELVCGSNDDIDFGIEGECAMKVRTKSDRWMMIN